MKEIIAIIRPCKSYETKNLLAQKGFFALSSYQVFGKGKGAPSGAIINDVCGEHKEINAPQMHAKTLIDMYVRDADVESVIEVIVKANKTDTHGDGKIFVLPCENALRIRTGEKKDEAIL
ncbi:MAG: P-II family nitrogen regulator [Endomicrobium sp.]|jgi:nitrogen regulatory protein PII|nr:P-II family nitrogen regulator [Endomicrobium sp.]